MSDASVADDTSTIRLFTPTRKAEIRIEREVLVAAARAKGVDYLDLESRFQNMRSALVHLCHHTSFRTSLDDQIKELIERTQSFLGHVSVQKMYSRAWVANLARATERLRVAYQKAMESERIVLDDVELYVEIIDLLREAYLKNEYSPVTLTDPYIYAQAQLIAANFPAYDRTLNEV